MGTRGPAAAPAKLRLVEGRGNGRDSGGRKVTEGPAFKRLPPQPPEWLSDAARDEWDRVVPELSRVDVVKAEDAAVLAAYCEAVSEFRAATEALTAAGALTIVTPSGIERPHPLVQVRAQASARLQALAREFGLTPSSEQNLSRESDDGDADNPF
jgi:P27 family predicted phage terminase small subunit